MSAGILLVLSVVLNSIFLFNMHFLTSHFCLAYFVAKKGEKIGIGISILPMFLYMCSSAYIYMPVCVCMHDCYFMLLHLFCDYVRFYVDVGTRGATS
jgi:hypothetical protein